MTDHYTTQGEYELCWRTNTEEKFVAILAMKKGSDAWKFVGKWAIGPIPINELENLLEATHKT